MATANANGVVLDYLDAGSGPPMLFVHGFPLDRSIWIGQLAALKGCCRVIAPDLRGFGQSPILEPDTPDQSLAGEPRHTMAMFADDLAALLDAIGVQEPVVLCGLSMGGYVGWQFALRHRTRLKALICCDTKAAADTAQGLAGRTKALEGTLAQGVEWIADEMLPKLFGAATKRERPELIAAVRETIVRNRPAGVCAAIRGLAARPDVTPDLCNLDVPALVVCGEDDVISPPTEMQAIAAAMPKAEYLLVRGAGHLAPLEQPELVSGSILEFLQSNGIVAR